MKTVQLSWHAGDDRFVGAGGNGVTISLDAPAPPPDVALEPAVARRPAGPTPSEVLLIAAGGCTAWDLVEILRKQRQDVTAIDISVTGDQDAEPPWAYRAIRLDVRVRGHGLDQRRVERAVSLSLDSYCSVVATIRGIADVVASTSVDELGPR